MKAVFDAPDRPGRWYGALEILRKRLIDWDYLGKRGISYAPKRILAFLLYACGEGVEVPNKVLTVLADASIDGAG